MISANTREEALRILHRPTQPQVPEDPEPAGEPQEDKWGPDNAEASGYVSSWGRVDTATALAESKEPPAPTVGSVVGAPWKLFYPGRVNAVFGEAESAKSLFLQCIAAQEVKAGHDVLYVDFEDCAGGVYARMRDLGCTEQLLTDHFLYVVPERSFTPVDRFHFDKLTDRRGTLAIFDGVTEAMALEGLSGRDENDVATWHTKITKPVAAKGWAVVVIDHVPHEEKRMIGSQHKRAVLSGVALLMEPVHPVTAGQRGLSRIRVDKDRSGGVRRNAAPGKRPQWLADFVADLSESEVPDAAIFPARPAPDELTAPVVQEAPPEHICRQVVHYVGRNPGCSKNAIITAVPHGKAKVCWALEWLAARSYLIVATGATRAHEYRLGDPFPGIFGGAE